MANFNEEAKRAIQRALEEHAAVGRQLPPSMEHGPGNIVAAVLVVAARLEELTNATRSLERELERVRLQS